MAQPQGCVDSLAYEALRLILQKTTALVARLRSDDPECQRF